MLPKGKVLILIGVIVLILIAIMAFQLRRGNNEPVGTPEPESSNNPFENLPVNDQATVQSPRIKSITPSDKNILTPGQLQTFKITFTETVNPNLVFINLKSKDIIEGENYQSIDFDKKYSEDYQSLEIKTKTPIAPSRSYNLSIYLSDGQTLLQATYSSDRVERTKEPDNNQSLAQFLPHKTDAYTLSYVPETNLYVFSFNYDANSAESLDNQYDKAKSDAIEFIKSKGIDPNSIKIDWRFH